MKYCLLILNATLMLMANAQTISQMQFMQDETGDYRQLQLAIPTGQSVTIWCGYDNNFAKATRLKPNHTNHRFQDYSPVPQGKKIIYYWLISSNGVVKPYSFSIIAPASGAEITPASPNYGNNKKFDRIALVIGNDSYDYADKLDGQPLRDAARMRDALQNLNFEVIYYKNLDIKQLKIVSDSFVARLKEQNYEVSILYFAGHGLHSKGRHWVLPTDANLTTVTQVDEQCLSLDKYLAEATQLKAQLNMVLTDDCRAEPFKSLVRKLNRGSATNQRAFLPSTQSYFIAHPTVEGKTTLNNGLFTTIWLEMMQLSSRPDLLEIAQRVKAKVKEKTEGKQTPINETNFKGEFRF